MNKNSNKEILKIIDNIVDVTKNNMQITIESYTEVLSKLDFLAHLIIKNDI